MQIQLNQVEIETAIRNYVHEQINVREGMQINITLKATRGDDGQTAIIDIVPKPEEKVVAPPPAQTSGVAIQRRPRMAQTAQAVTNEGKAAQDPAQSQGVSGSVGDVKEETGNAMTEAQTAVADNSTSSAADATTGDVADASQAGEEKPASERKSLFSGLSRPVNS